MYQINAPGVVSDTLDGEAIIINLETGMYYSLEGSAAVIWKALCEGASEGDIALAFQDSFDQATEIISTFTQELVREQLLVPISSDGPTNHSWKPSHPSLPAGFPVINRFADMHDLLLLDPIHMVGAEGWPHRAEEPHTQHS